jgi:hypothetical protein
MENKINKRIEELAEQCGFRANPDIYNRNQSFDIAKFAQLIVQECARSWSEPTCIIQLKKFEKGLETMGVTFTESACYLASEVVNTRIGGAKK